MKVREPVARPLDVVAVELLLSASQAFLAGVLLYMAAGFWEDAGIGLGSVAAILVLLGLGVGAAWLYWLMGGVGWPMAAVNAPAALFFAFTLVMGWTGETFEVGGAPLLLATTSAIFGIVAGVFLDSPRRWRWDQREKLRPGTRVPRVSSTTQALAAQVPRSRPSRRTEEESVSELAARIEHSSPAASDAGGDLDIPYVEAGARAGEDETVGTTRRDPSGPVAEPESELTDAPEVEGTPLEVPEAPEPVMPTARLARGNAAEETADAADDEDDEDEKIELPTMIEPKAQRSPWAWAAPPQWNREEEDEPGARSSDEA